MSKTISITIPDQLEDDLQMVADDIGISRSRFIGNLLLQWNEDRKEKENKLNNDTEVI